MISALVFVVLVSAKDAETTETAALERSVQDALGAEADLQFRTSEPVDDIALAALTQDADAAAEVIWLDSTRRRAAIHCCLKKWQRMVVREVAFKDEDQLAERGRLLGYALAAMLPEPDTVESPSPAARESAAVAASPTPVAEARPPGKQALAAAELNALGSVGIGGPAQGLGVSAAGRWFFLAPLSLRVVAGIRRGNVPEAHADSQWAFGGVGIDFPFSQPGDGSHFSFGGRFDLLAGAFSMRRRSTTGAPEHQERFSGGADLLAEATYFPWPRTGLKLSTGGELAFGDTDVYVAGAPITDIPPLRFVTELGVLALF